MRIAQFCQHISFSLSLSLSLSLCLLDDLLRVGPITPQKIAAAEETGIPTVPTDFFHALLVFYGRKAFFSLLYILFWLSVPKGSLTKYLTAVVVERTVSKVLYIRSHIFDTGREEEEESPSQWENKNEMIALHWRTPL